MKSVARITNLENDCKTSSKVEETIKTGLTEVKTEAAGLKDLLKAQVAGISAELREITQKLKLLSTRSPHSATVAVKTANGDLICEKSGRRSHSKRDSPRGLSMSDFSGICYERIFAVPRMFPGMASRSRKYNLEKCVTPPDGFRAEPNFGLSDEEDFGAINGMLSETPAAADGRNQPQKAICSQASEVFYEALEDNPKFGFEDENELEQFAIQESAEKEVGSASDRKRRSRGAADFALPDPAIVVQNTDEENRPEPAPEMPKNESGEEPQESFHSAANFEM